MSKITDEERIEKLVQNQWQLNEERLKLGYLLLYAENILEKCIKGNVTPEDIQKVLDLIQDKKPHHSTEIDSYKQELVELSEYQFGIYSGVKKKLNKGDTVQDKEGNTYTVLNVYTNENGVVIDTHVRLVGEANIPFSVPLVEVELVG